MTTIRTIVHTLAMGVAAVAMAACGAPKGAVEFATLHNYFYRNDAPGEARLLKLTSRAAFERYFGEAAVMGTDGEPTQVDFDKCFVIACVLPETHVATEIQRVDLHRAPGRRLVMDYAVVRGERHDYVTRPTIQIAVSRRYADYTVTLRKHNDR